jgi:methylmalonyl-CoA/ethylmalonyl-CoA epimerase
MTSPARIASTERFGSSARPGLTVAGNSHRVAVAVDDLDGAVSTWQRLFGFGLMLDPVTDDLDKSRMGIVWAGNMPLLGLSSTDPDGTVGRYLKRNGPGVQSLAWEIDDMWGTDHRLRANGIAVTGVHIEGRHFFMHPRDTFGLLLEFTDDTLPHDPRQGDEAPPTTEPIIAVDGIARVTAAVADLDAVAAQFRLIFGVEASVPPSDGSTKDKIVDFLVGDLVVRLVEPFDGDSPFAVSVHGANGRLHSVGLAVSDFAGVDEAIARAGLGVTARSAQSVWIDPADMHGIRFELVG